MFESNVAGVRSLMHANVDACATSIRNHCFANKVRTLLHRNVARAGDALGRYRLLLEPLTKNLLALAGVKQVIAIAARPFELATAKQEEQRPQGGTTLHTGDPTLRGGAAQDLKAYAHHASALHAKCDGGSFGYIDDSLAPAKRSAIRNSHDNRLLVAKVCHSNPGAKGQGAMGGG